MVERDAAGKLVDEFVAELADEFEWSAPGAACPPAPSCECASGLGAGLPGRAEALYFAGCPPF